jgi:hypothetical protein
MNNHDDEQMRSQVPLGSIAPLSDAAIQYAWRQLARRAGVIAQASYGTGFEALPLRLCYGEPIDHAAPEKVPLFIVTPAPQTAWVHLTKRPEKSIDWLPPQKVFPHGSEVTLDIPVPALFWGSSSARGRRTFASRWKGDGVVFHVDIIATTLFMLSRWEETVNDSRDEHGRFPAEASVAYQQGFLERPIVDEYALILRAWLKVLCPGWQPAARKFSLKLSHDIDHVQRFSDWKQGLRTLGGDVLKRRDLSRAGQSLRGTLARLGTPALDPHIQGIRILASISRQYGLSNDAFYFMAADPTPFDSGYDPHTPFVKKCIDDLERQGFEIGFHPSYETFLVPAQLAEEKSRLDTLVSHPVSGGRQHYLRFQVPETWRHLEQVGLNYDATLGYARHAGFRCGTCHPFRPFDLEAQRVLQIEERPLIAMDKTFQNYQGLTPEQTVDAILRLAHRCKQVGGEFSLLWHNGSKDAAWYPSSALYQKIVRLLTEM